MELQPPPYSPQSDSLPMPTAPPVNQMLPSYSPHHSPATPHAYSYPMYHGSNPAPNNVPPNAGVPYQQNQLYPQLFPPNQQAMSSSQTPTTAQATLLRCKAGTVDVNFENATNENDELVWMTQYIEVNNGELKMAPSRDNRTNMKTRSLKTYYISVRAKKQIAIEDTSSSSMIRIKAPSEVRAHEWFMALSQYCFVAPMMEGYCDKLNRRKKKYEERFLRLTSDGVLSWYGSDSEDSDRRDSIQVRGERCEIDSSSSQIVNIHVQPKTYQFRFSSSKEAQQWLAAFNWHRVRTPLKKAIFPLKNKAK